jgi:hypothetical protein
MGVSMIPVLFLLTSQKNDNGPGLEPDPGMVLIGILFGLVIAGVILLPYWIVP